MDTAKVGRSGQKGGSALYGPCQRNLSRGLVNTLCDARDHWIVHYFGLHGMPQRCKRLHNYSMLPAEIDHVPFREIWMGLDLDRGRLDSRNRNDLFQPFQSYIRQTNRLATTTSTRSSRARHV